MTFNQFVALYGDLIRFEYETEHVWETLRITLNTYMKWKYEGYIEALEGLKEEGYA